MVRKTKISVSINADLAQIVDCAVRTMGKSRSNIYEEALKLWVQTKFTESLSEEERDLLERMDRRSKESPLFANLVRLALDG